VEDDVKRFRKARGNEDLEARLRQERPEPGTDFVQRLAAHISNQTQPSIRRAARGRIAVVAVALAVIASVFGAFGGIGYAASAVKTAAVAVKTVVVAPTPASPTVSPSSAKSDDKKSDGKGDDKKGDDKKSDGKGDDKGDKPADKEYGHKTTLCHNPGPHQQTLEVSDNAVPAHLGHGDYLGACHR
jgi:hypothetical protein